MLCERQCQKMGRQATDWEKISAEDISDKKTVVQNSQRTIKTQE